MMSKNKTPMIRWYWNEIGGTLVNSFHRVPDSIMRSTSPRCHRLPKRATRIAQWREVSLEGEEVIVVY